MPMVEIPTLDPSEAPRARRWDALVLGSGLSALVAAARISAAGQRVLVVEEEARAKQPPAMKEPFFLGGLRDQGLLDATLRTLAVPLIDRRRITNERLAYQIAADPYRLDVGQPLLTAEELVAWGLAKPEEAQRLVRRRVEASEVERALLYESSFVRIGRHRAAAGPALGGQAGTSAMIDAGITPGRHKRGLSEEITGATGPLARSLDAEIRALSNLAHRTPSPEARARLLGLALGGGAGFADDPPWLLDLLRKRVTSLYGELRTLPGDFELVQVAGQPGVRVLRSGEIWLGRCLVLAAAPSAIADSYGEEGDRPPGRGAPSLLSRPNDRAYRAAFLFRVDTSVLPEAMGARLILPGSLAVEENAARRPTACVTAFPCQTHPARVDLVVRAVLEDVARDTLADRLDALQTDLARRLRDLMPFCGDGLSRVDVPIPRWDGDDGWLEDPVRSDGWPGEIDLRMESRPPVFCLDRSGVGGLGLEGDLLLGWRGGDAIAAELS
jgi:choline dehydrogenase-like flavoprotein